MESRGQGKGHRLDSSREGKGKREVGRSESRQISRCHPEGLRVTGPASGGRGLGREAWKGMASGGWEQRLLLQP